MADIHRIRCRLTLKYEAWAMGQPTTIAKLQVWPSQQILTASKSHGPPTKNIGGNPPKHGWNKLSLRHSKRNNIIEQQSSNSIDMGTACTGTGRIPSTSYIDQEPPDVASFPKLEDAVQLAFELELSNVKLLRLKPETTAQALSMQLLIESVMDVILQSKPVKDSVVKWKGTHRARILLDNYQLRKTHLKLVIFSESRIKLGHVQLNLYSIAVGPYHQDFPVKLTDGSLFRLSLDVRVSQLVRLLIQPTAVGIDLATQHPGEVFSYTLRTTDDNGRAIESGESYKAETILYNKRVSVTELDPPTPTLKKQRSFKSRKSLVVENGKRLTWSNDEAKVLYQEELPLITPEVNVSRIANYGFQLQLWRVQKDTSQDCQEEQPSEQIILYAEAQINLNKVFVGQPVLEKVNGQDHQRRRCEIVEKLWNQGKLLGSVSLQCRVVTIPFYRQKVMCIRTERGVIPAHAMFGGGPLNQSASCQQIRTILSLKLTIEQAVVKLNAKQNDKKQQWLQLEARRSIFTSIDKMTALFEVSANGKHTRLYSYRSTEDLRRGQMVLLDAGLKLLEFLLEEDETVADAAWKALTEFINRDEFSLIHVGFTAQELKNPDSCSKQIIEMRLKYQSFLEEALKLCLASLSKKAMLDNERVFAILFTAQAFLRVPEYRQKVIQLVNKGESDKYLLDEFGYSPGTLPVQLDETLKPVLDWKGYFSQPLTKHASQQNLLRLRETLQNPQVRQRMEKRGIAFFCQLGEFLCQVGRLTPFVHINWEAIPGYRELVRAFLCQMKTRDMKHYPDSLKQASVRLLCNQDLLNIQIRLLFSKTNVHSHMNVVKTLQLLDKYFNYFSQAKEARLPACFDYNHFYAGLKILLSSDHSFVVMRTLNLIYRHYQLFSASFRRDLAFCLMGQTFFRLFLNWASNVRMVFQHILYYRIRLSVASQEQPGGSTTSLGKIRSTVQLVTQQSIGIDETQADEIRSRFTTVMAMLRDAHSDRMQHRKHSVLEKEYYRKMKSKLIQKRLGRKLPTMLTSKSLNSENDGPARNTFHVHRHQSQLTPVNMVITQLKQISPNCHDGLRQSLSPIARDSKKKTTNLLLTQIAEIGDNKQKKKRRSGLCADFQIGQIESEMIPYLEEALKQYACLEASPCPSPPVLSVCVPMDQGDLRPDDIDEW